MKKLVTRSLWNFELGTQEGTAVPTYIIVGFYQRKVTKFEK